MDLSIIIVNFNSAAYVEACLKSIQQHPPECAYEVVVVDSGSFDGCGRMLGERFIEVRFLQCGNVGFAGANNAGARLARGELLLFLNPDTEVRAGALQQLVKAIRSLPDSGAMGAHLLNSDGSTQTSCVKAFPTLTSELMGSRLLRERFPEWAMWGAGPLRAAGEDPVPARVISGACLLARGEIYRKAGGFSEDYFMYSEDVELCWQFERLGCRNYFVPGAKVVHHGGGSTTGGSLFSAVMMRESRWRYFRKTRGIGYALAFRVLLAAGGLGRILLAGIGAVIGRGPRWRHALRKWLAVVGWCLGSKAPTPPRTRAEAPVAEGVNAL